MATAWTASALARLQGFANGARPEALLPSAFGIRQACASTYATGAPTVFSDQHIVS
jgi:hypothetical protein